MDAIMVLVVDSDGARDRQRSSVAARLHIVDGLVRALESMEVVGRVIDASPTRDDALNELTSPPWSFSVEQAHYILDMSLVRRTRIGRKDLQEEAEALSRALEELDRP